MKQKLKKKTKRRIIFNTDIMTTAEIGAPVTPTENALKELKNLREQPILKKACFARRRKGWRLFGPKLCFRF